MSTKNNDNVDLSFGERLRKLRRMRNYTQDQLAHLLDISKAYVSKLEKGEREPSVHLKNVINEWLERGDSPKSSQSDKEEMKRWSDKVAATIEPGSPEKKHDLLSRRRKLTAPGEQTVAPPDESFDEDQAIDQTRYVLRSDTVYRSALVSNIRAFYQGVKREEEMSGVDDRMRSMKEQLDRLEKMIESLGGLVPEKRANSDS